MANMLKIKINISKRFFRLKEMFKIFNKISTSARSLSDYVV